MNEIVFSRTFQNIGAGADVNAAENLQSHFSKVFAFQIVFAKGKLFMNTWTHEPDQSSEGKSHCIFRV